MTVCDAIETYLGCPYDHAALEAEWDALGVTGTLLCGGCRRTWRVTDGIISLMPDYYYAHPTQSGRTTDDCADRLSELATRDDQASVYESLFSSDAHRIEEATTLKEFDVSASDVVVEVGVGTGRMLGYAARCRAVIGCDYSRDSLRCLQRKGHRRVVLVQADATLLPLRDASIDAMLSAELFMHIPSQTLRRQHLAEAARCLRPGGEYLMGGVYNFGLRERLRDVQMVYTRDDVHGGADGKTGYHTNNRIYYYNFDIRELRREGERHFEVLDLFGFLVDLGVIGNVLRRVLGAYRADRIWHRTVIGDWLGKLLLMRMRKRSGLVRTTHSAPAAVTVAVGR